MITRYRPLPKLLLTSIVAIAFCLGLTCCYNNDAPDQPSPMQIRYEYPMAQFSYDKFSDLPSQVQQNWRSVADRPFVVTRPEDFPSMTNFNPPPELDTFDFKAYSMLVYYSRQVGPLLGSQNYFFKDPSTGGYLWEIIYKEPNLDLETRFTFVRTIIVVNKIDPSFPFNVTLYWI